MDVIIQQILEDMKILPLEMQAEALDFVCFLKTKLIKTEAVELEQEPSGRNASAIMSEIAVRGRAFQGIEDPVAWQRDMRQDRPLPGRN
jgi:hypothetical protein